MVFCTNSYFGDAPNSTNSIKGTNQIQRAYLLLFKLKKTMKKILIPIALLLLCCCSNEDDLCTYSDTQYDDSIMEIAHSPEFDPNAKMEDAYWDTFYNQWTHYDETSFFINKNGDTIFYIDYYKKR